MSFYRKYFDVAFCFTFWSFTVAAPSTENFLSEYYWGSRELRTQDDMNCESDLLKLLCSYKSGNRFHKCKNYYFQCLNRKSDDGNDKDKRLISRTIDRPEPFDSFEDNKYLLNSNEFVDSGLSIDALRMPIKTQSEEEISGHPALRHHIAHFCPNLEQARQCIRSCMKVGKPAFCGKDHVCYCGHKYSPNDKDKDIKLDDMYAEFRDLYQKYFGPQGGNGRDHDENHGSDEPEGDHENYNHEKI